MSDTMPHGGLMTVVYASDTQPSWAVIDWGREAKPAARIVGMFYNQAEAHQYSYWRRKHLATTTQCCVECGQPYEGDFHTYCPSRLS